jgi:hypothetical protein
MMKSKYVEFWLSIRYRFRALPAFKFTYNGFKWIGWREKWGKSLFSHEIGFISWLASLLSILLSAITKKGRAISKDELSLTTFFLFIG